MSGTGETAGGGDERRGTALMEEHRRLGARLAEFAGWEMPLWYAGASDEHAAVRRAAGLFDIGHMGIIEITGAEALRFADVVGTNAMSSLEVGRCRYTFLLDHDGLPLDDIIISRVGEDSLLAVVNAANAAKVWRWLDAIAAGRAPIDPADPASAREFELTLRELSAPSAGADRLTGMALQGPASAELLAALVTAAGGLPELPRFALAETELLGSAAIISRTGYTGESTGYEIFVHPEDAPDLWRAILKGGAERGVLPAGLAARDSLRIEAGLPLYGHELAGPHEITPSGAGYERFVDFDREFFIGREALLRREQERGEQIVRFRLDRDGARAIRGDDPVGSRRGQMVGRVTSCAPVGDTQIGMAWVDRTMAREGTELLLYPARHLERSADSRDVAALQPGDRLPMHEPATVLPRFPR
ncbi:MAG: glycine cleavage system aminomethyltransferase GcvT [Armatimonadota bacterium]